jgi:hypothetical protein
MDSSRTGPLDRATRWLRVVTDRDRDGRDVVEASRGNARTQHLLHFLALIVLICIYESIHDHTAWPLVVPAAFFTTTIVSPRMRRRMLSQALWRASRSLGDQRPQMELSTPSPSSGTELVNFFIPGSTPVSVPLGGFYTGAEGSFMLLSVSLTNRGKMPAVLTRTILTPHPAGKLMTTKNLVEPGESVRINAAVMTAARDGEHAGSARDRFQLRVAYSDLSGTGRFVCVAELNPYWGVRLVNS